MRGRDLHGVIAFVTAAILLWSAAGVVAQDAATGKRPAHNVYLYDMGTDTSPLWAGFARVTPATNYDAKRGYGWVKPGKWLRGYVADYLDALAADYTCYVADLTLDFRQDLPNGEYEVWVLEGSYLSLRYLMCPHSLWLQGKPALDIRPAQEEVFRCVKYEWSKGDDVYDHFVVPRFTWHRAEATVSDGKLEIGFVHSRDFPVCALVIARKDVADRVQREIGRIDARRRAAFHNIWHGIPPKEAHYENVSPEERERGYMVSAVNYLEDVLPDSVPTMGASRSKVEVFAAPGEQEQASFCVYALTPLRQVRFDVTDLRGAQGGVVPAAKIERGLVQFTPVRIGHEPKYRIAPTLILPLRPTFIGSNTCKQFWMTVHVPENAAAGVYEGTIAISALDAPPVSMSLRLRVLPFKLMVPPVERYFYFGSMIYHARALMPAFDEKKYWESVRAEARYLKENEFCLAQCLINRYGSRVTWKDGKKDGEIVDVDVSPTYKIMEIIKAEDAWPRDNSMICLTGMLNTICGGYWRSRGERGLKFAQTPEGRANFIRAIKIIEEKGKKAGWPEIAFECGGEYTNYRQQGAEFAVAVHSAFKDAGVHNALRGNGPSDMAAIAKGLVDYPQPNWALMKKKDLAVIKANAKRLWFYNFSTGRFGYGWWCFKHGVTRAAHEGGIYFHRQPGNIFDNQYGDFPVGGLPTGLTSLTPTVKLKRMAEGADDYKYLYMLDKLIKEAKASGKPGAERAARAAQVWLDKKLDGVPDGTDALSGLAEWYNEVRKGVSWYLGDFDKYRWEMAEHISALRKALRR